MSSLEGIEITGFNELMAKLRLLGDDKDKRRESLMILRQVAKSTVSAAKEVVPVSKKAHVGRREKINPGNLKKSIGLITGKSKEVPTIYAGPRVKGVHKGWYGHFVHGGHKIYNNSAAGRNKLKRYRQKRKLEVVAGRVVGFPFMDIAYNQTKGGVASDAEKRFAKFIQRRINKLSL